MANKSEKYTLPEEERITDFPKPGPDWFSKLFGFQEVRDHQEMQRFLFVDNNLLVSRVNGKAYNIGQFSTPSLAELREKVLGNEEIVKATKGKLVMKVKEGEVSALQAAKENRLALFQAASQFNCLEFVGPSVVPEDGVTGYVFDRTQVCGFCFFVFLFFCFFVFLFCFYFFPPFLITPNLPSPSPLFSFKRAQLVVSLPVQRLFIETILFLLTVKLDKQEII